MPIQGTQAINQASGQPPPDTGLNNGSIFPNSTPNINQVLSAFTSNPADPGLVTGDPNYAANAWSQWGSLTQGIMGEDYALAQQFISEYESGKLPPGAQAAINLAYGSGTASLAGSFAAEGVDPTGSTMFAGGMQTLQQQRSIATQQALDQLLQQAFQSQGISLQAAGMLEQYNEFEQQLQLEYLQTWLQNQQAQQQQQQQGKGQVGQLAGSLGGMFGGKAIIGAIAKIVALALQHGGLG